MSQNTYKSSVFLDYSPRGTDIGETSSSSDVQGKLQFFQHPVYFMAFLRCFYDIFLLAG